jgi:poly(beta-D-mannuronate) lyase
MTTYSVDNKSDLLSKIKTIQKGDTLIIKNGTYDSIDIDLTCKGDCNNKILIKAETNNKVIFKGTPFLRIRGEFIKIVGITFDKLKTHVNTVQVMGSNNRISECSFLNYNFSHEHIINIQGTYHRIDHCLFKNITKTGLCIFLARPVPLENYILIDNNTFCDRTSVKGADNELEIIRVGTSDQSLSSSKTMILNNILNNCDGEIEAISIKSGENIIFGNHLVNSRGTITLRHGNTNFVAKNFIDGSNKVDSGGIRVIGDNHLVSHNFITNIKSELISNVAICVCNGQTKPKLNGYWTPHNCTIKKNIIYKCTCGFGIGCKVKSDSVEKPCNICISDNICVSDVGFNTSHDIMFNDEAEYSNNKFNVKDIGHINPIKRILSEIFTFTPDISKVGKKFLDDSHFNFDDDNKVIYCNLKKIIADLDNC